MKHTTHTSALGETFETRPHFARGSELVRHVPTAGCMLYFTDAKGTRIWLPGGMMRTHVRHRLGWSQLSRVGGIERRAARRGHA